MGTISAKETGLYRPEIGMVTSINQLNEWLNAPRETENLEFKAAREQMDTRSLREYCVAIANEGGGKLLLGISDKPPRSIIGSAAFPNTADIAGKLLTWLRFRVDVEEFLHSDGRIVIFHIPSRPQGTAYQHNGAYLMRSGEELVPMSEDRLRQIFDEGKPDWGEAYAVEGLSLQEVVELLDAQSFFELLELPFPKDQSGILDRLIQEQLIDEKHGKFSIRRLGALLLARRLSDFPKEITRKAPRVEVYAGSTKVQTKLSQDGVKGYAVGFQGLVNFIMNQLPQNEVCRFGRSSI